MNWKFFLGKAFYKAQQTFIRSDRKFIRKNFPYGIDWMYDIKRVLKNPSVIIDAGANIGSVSLDLNFWFPDADIYAFEPVKETFDILTKNTAAKNKIHPVYKGLGTKNEKINIFLSWENTINSLKITEVNQGIMGSEEVHIIRLDEFLQQERLTTIDILKIDVEGFEFEVLEGCGTLINDNIKCIYLEVGYTREPTKVYFSDVEIFMENNGFELCGIYETKRNAFSKHQLWFSNHLYIKKALLS